MHFARIVTGARLPRLPRLGNALAACKTLAIQKDFNSALVKELPLRAATGAADPADVARAERNVGPTHAHGGCGAHVVMAPASWADEAEAVDARIQELITRSKEAMRRQAEQDKENAELANRQAKMRESIKGVAAEYVCPLTRELPVDPVVATDGRIYERSHILAWLSRNATSPVTREPMGTELTPMPLIRNSIEKLVMSGAIEGDIAEAWQKSKVKECRAKAEAGDTEAMYRLGAWYQFGGYGLAIDEAQARAWLERSAAARDPKGMACFGRFLLRGIGGPEDNAFGLVNVTEAAHLGSDLGAYILGLAFGAGRDGLPKVPAFARFWLKKVVDGECEFKGLSDQGLANAARWLRELESGGE